MALTDAAEGLDWEQKTEQEGAHVINRFEALTPRGAVFLTELAEIGFFGDATAAALSPSSILFG